MTHNRWSNSTGTNSTGFSPARIFFTHTKVTSKSIIYPNPNHKQKYNPKFRPRILKPNTYIPNSLKGRSIRGFSIRVRNSSYGHSLLDFTTAAQTVNPIKKGRICVLKTNNTNKIIKLASPFFQGRSR